MLALQGMFIGDLAREEELEHTQTQLADLAGNAPEPHS